MTLKHKFSLLVAICTLLLLGLNYGFSVYSANNALFEFNQRSAIILSTSLLETSDVEQFIEESPEDDDMSVISNALFSAFTDQLFMLISNKKLIAHSLNIDGSNDLSELSLSTVTNGYQFEIRHPTRQPVIVQISRPQITFSRQDTEYQVFYFPRSTLSRQVQQEMLREDLNHRFLISLIVLSIIAIILSWLGASYFLRPLTQLKDSFLAMKSGELNTRLAIKRQDEVGDIVNEFNQLAAWLQGLHQQYEQMNSDLSHELRTPLNAIQSRIEAMEDGLIVPDKKQFKQLRDELAVLSRIVEDLNLLSLSESRALQLNITDTNISDLSFDLLEKYKPRAQAADVKLKNNIENNVHCNIDKDRLRQVLVNLLDNAFKYGANGGEISLNVEKNGAKTQISVSDKGVGLSPEQSNAVFDRFFRVQASRTSFDSLGLGLPICRHLVELMGGEIKVMSAPNKGCKFIITFSEIS